MTKLLARRWPRAYLSWSQFDLWTRSPDQYVMKYIYREEPPTTPAMMLGKRMADMLENREIPAADQMFEHYRQFLPRYEHREKDIRCEYAGVPLLAKPDGFTVHTAFNGIGSIDEIHATMNFDLGEYKTGKSWTQERADEHGQIDFYVISLLVSNGFSAADVARVRPVIHWIPTYTVNRMPTPTGEIVNFITPRSEKQIITFGSRLVRAWAEIGDRCAQEYAAIGQ